MSGIAVAVLLVIVIPALLLAGWQVMQSATVRVESGTVGLLLAGSVIVLAVTAARLVDLPVA